VRILVADSRVMRQTVTRTLRQAGFSGHDLPGYGGGSLAVVPAR
jgi:hypothetical protein